MKKIAAVESFFSPEHRAAIEKRLRNAALRWITSPRATYRRTRQQITRLFTACARPRS